MIVQREYVQVLALSGQITNLKIILLFDQHMKSSARERESVSGTIVYAISCETHTFVEEKGSTFNLRQLDNERQEPSASLLLCPTPRLSTTIISVCATFVLTSPVEIKSHSFCFRPLRTLIDSAHQSCLTSMTSLPS